MTFYYFTAFAKKTSRIGRKGQDISEVFDFRIWRNTLVVLNIKPLNIAQYQGSSVVKI